MQKLGGAGEWEIRDDSERLARQRKASGVVLDDVDVRPSIVEPGSETRIELDGNDASRDVREHVREATRSRSDLDDEIVAPYPGARYELRREGLGAEEVLATRRRRPRARCASACHGRSGSLYPSR